MAKIARPAILLLAAVALAASVAALYVHYRLIADPTYQSFCDVSATVSCEAGGCCLGWRASISSE